MAAIYSAFLSGLVSDNPLSSGATTLNSSGLASMPVVAAPNYMWLVLDPNGAGGTPEIVQVTAHSASATSCTIVRGQQSTSAHSHVLNTPWVVAATPSDFDELPFRKVTTKGDMLVATAANTVTRLPVGTDGLPLVADSAQANGVAYEQLNVGALATAVQNLLVPAGTTATTVAAAAPTGWLFFNQTVVNAQTLYPSLWAVAPAGWKSGSSLVLPDTRDKFIVGAGSSFTLGTAAGSNTKTIGTGNLPSHSHTIDHDHPAGTTSTVSSDHSHGFSGTTDTQGNHAHTTGVASNGFISDGAGNNGSAGIASGAGFAFTTVTGTTGAHAHNYSGNTGGISANHTHTFDVAAISGSSGSTGSGTALDITPANLALNWMIKAH